MTRIRIIGIGSPFGDDRIGWDAVAALEAGGILKRYPAGLVDACRCARPGGGNLLMLFQEVDAVILIDAMASGAPAGTVRKLATGELQAGQGMLSSHGIGVAETIALGRELNLLPATVVVYGVEVRSVKADSEPHPEVSGAIPVLVGAVTGELEQLVPASARRGYQRGRQDHLA